jgi:hypothetical protein
MMPTASPPPVIVGPLPPAQPEGQPPNLSTPPVSLVSGKTCPLPFDAAPVGLPPYPTDPRNGWRYDNISRGYYAPGEDIPKPPAPPMPT